MESSISESKPRSTRPTGIYGQSIPVIEDYFVNPTGFSARESGLIVPDRMKNDSFSLLISGEVDGAMFDGLTKSLMTLEDYGVKFETLNIELASYGGDVYLGFAVFDILSRYKKEKKISLNITSYGPVMSMGALILQAGDVRRMSTNAVMLIHPISGMMEGNKDEMKAEAVQMDRLDEVYKGIFVERAKTCGVDSTTNQVMHELTNAHNSAGTYLSAQEAKKYGFVDEII